MIHVFLPGASYIEQLDSVPGKSGACRFSPEKLAFPAHFGHFAMQFTWHEFLSYSRDKASHIIDRLSATPQLCTQLMYGSGLRVGEVLRLYSEPKAESRICGKAVSE